ncbi:alpha-tocopherol transfer protein-like isoform X2 [Polyergus mexicanus]
MSSVTLPTRYVTIEEEFKRNLELKMSDLQMLKDWTDKQPHLPKIEMFYFVLFLHSNYYRLESTKKTIDNFFTSRTHMPEVFSNRDPIAWKELRKAFTVVAAVPLEQKIKKEYIMTFGKFLDPDPSKFDYLECIKYFFMTCEVQNLIRGTNEGLIVIIDASGLSFAHIARLNLMNLKKIVYYIQEASPIRLKAIHIFNTGPIIDTLLNMIKPFAKAELLELMHFHSSLETAQKFLPIESLPNEYGGKAGSIEEIVTKHIKLLEEFREWFQYDELVGRVNESLRVDKCQNTENLFGVDGSFKRLEID